MYHQAASKMCYGTSLRIFRNSPERRLTSFLLLKFMLNIIGWCFWYGSFRRTQGYRDCNSLDGVRSSAKGRQVCSAGIISLLQYAYHVLAMSISRICDPFSRMHEVTVWRLRIVISIMWLLITLWCSMFCVTTMQFGLVAGSVVFQSVARTVFRCCMAFFCSVLD